MTNGSVRVIVVDDEPVARRRLIRMLGDHAMFDIVGEAGDGMAALAAIADASPDLVFLDIQMPGMTGMDVAGRMAGPSGPLIVFVTALDRFAADAFALDAVDYLLKPYDEDRVAAMAARVLRRTAGTAAAPSAPRRDWLVALSRGETRLLAVTAIERIDAADNYVEVTMIDGNRHLVRETLDGLADDLPSHFVRVSRATIARSDRIASMRSAGHGDAVLTMADGSEMRLSRRYRPRLLAAVPALGR